MSRYLIDLMYDGRDFHGWQSQPSGNTVQDKLDSALSTVLGTPTRTTGASRTDSGVHARQQIATFDGPADLDTVKLTKSLHGLLPEAIGVSDIRAVDVEFHPIRSAISKIYRYQLWTGSRRDPFLEPYIWRVPASISLERMQSATRVFEGTHDFSSFCAADSSAKTKVRTIDKISISKDGLLIQIEFLGNGFLKQMVRAIVGSLVDVGLAKLTEEELAEVLAKKDRTLAGKTAPARGLCLMSIQYE